MNARKFLTILLAIVMLSSLVVVSASASAFPGDVNNDGTLNAKDYLMLKKRCIGTVSLTVAGEANADMNGDGKIDAKDYVVLKRKILRGDTQPPVQKTPVELVTETLQTKELTTTFDAVFSNLPGTATVSFEVINGKLTLCGQVKTESDITVEINIPFDQVYETYAFSGNATYMSLDFIMSGYVNAANYSDNALKLDDLSVKLASNGMDFPVNETISTMCKDAMDEFLKEANALLENENVGVTIKDFGFVKFYDEISK